MFTYSAANAQEVKTKLYDLIQTMERGVHGYEIRLQGNKPNLTINREQFHSFLETLDMLQNNEATDCIRAIKKQKYVLLAEKTSTPRNHGNKE